MVTDFRPLHRQALEVATGYVAGIEDDALVRPTPCAGWDLRDLLAHMIGQHHGFAAAVTDGDAPESAYAPRDVLPGAWQESVDVLLAAFAAADLSRTVRLVEISTDRLLPAGVAISFQLLDTVIHTWDVATALGRSFVPDAETAGTTLALAKLVPQGDNRLKPGAAFAPALRPDTPDDWTQALALTGRS
ncbi:MAG TPA: TIGR03086 family metal-binding protein [Mycobacteriales bacterium]|nr:TIGR03086 family metal-binding protein [Mycobacteriales bacterium]